MHAAQTESTLSRWVRLAALLALAACAESAEPEPVLRVRTSTIVYGTDDRVDVYAYPDPSLRELAKSSLVALVPNTNLGRLQDGEVELTSQPLEGAYGLCPGERYASQPSAVSCSGVLIADDLVLTAAHCLRKGFGNDLDCQRSAYVFDYVYAEEGKLELITDDDVYACREIVALQTFAKDASTAIEYAVIRLDRVVAAPRKPAIIRRQELAVGELLIAVSFPSGLPAKIDPGAQVFDTRSESFDFFRISSDTFGSSSGGGLFDSRGELVGVLVSGGADFEMTDAGCLMTHTILNAADGSPWEQATYAWRAQDALCDTDHAPEMPCSNGALDDAGIRPARSHHSDCALSVPQAAKSASVFELFFLGVLLVVRRRATKGARVAGGFACHRVCHWSRKNRGSRRASSRVARSSR